MLCIKHNFFLNCIYLRIVLHILNCIHKLYYFVLYFHLFCQRQNTDYTLIALSVFFHFFQHLVFGLIHLYSVLTPQGIYKYYTNLHSNIIPTDVNQMQITNSIDPF